MSERFTVQLDSDNSEWVETQARTRDRSKAWIINESLRAVRGENSLFVNTGEVNTGEHHTSEVKTGENSRLEEIEERLDELEQRLEPSPNAHERDARSEPGHAAHEGATNEPADTEEQKQSDATHSGSETPDDLDEILLGVYDGMERREARREAGLATLQWLRDRGAAHSAEGFKDALFPEHRTNGESAKIWWRKNARPALQAAADAGLVEYRAGYNDYRWTG